jgi:hypothetical protein
VEEKTVGVEEWGDKTAAGKVKEADVMVDTNDMDMVTVDDWFANGDSLSSQSGTSKVRPTAPQRPDSPAATDNIEANTKIGATADAPSDPTAGESSSRRGPSKAHRTALRWPLPTATKRRASEIAEDLTLDLLPSLSDPPKKSKKPFKGAREGLRR